MAKTLAEVQAAQAELDSAIDEQTGETVKLIKAVDDLLARVPVTPDLQPLFDSIQASKAKLVGDNAAVQAALDKANAPATPPVA